MTSLWARLGSCLYCTRSAFRSALIAWGVSGIACAAGAGQGLPTLVVIAACALTGLWLAHLIAHALRAARPARYEARRGLSRRAVFVSTFASAAVLSSAPRLAFAQCSDETAARCQSAEQNCHAGCDSLFHRVERNHACHQECSSNYAGCKTGAGCG